MSGTQMVRYSNGRYSNERYSNGRYSNGRYSNDLTPVVIYLQYSSII